MTPQELERLLGGYATNTLTEEERTTLFAAALEDQKLFDALADEEVLRELLSDPAARGEVLAVLAGPEPWFTRFQQWLMRPAGLAAAGAAAVAVLALVFVWRPSGEKPPQQVAMVAEKRAIGNAPAAQEPERLRPSPSGPRIETLDLSRKGAPAPMMQPLAPSAEADTEATPLRDQASKPKEVARNLAAAPPAEEMKVAGAVRSGVRKDVADWDGRPFRYFLERREAEGAWVRIDPSSTLARGDRVRFVVESGSPGTVLLRAGTATVQVAAFVPGAPVALPEFMLDDPSGESRITLEVGGATGASQVMKSRMKAESASVDEARPQAPSGITVILRYR